MRINILIIIINIILITICTLYAIGITKLSGKDSKDEMMKYFKEKTFRDIGIMLTSISGIFLIINIFILYTYHGNLEETQLINYISSDIKYLTVSILIYLYNTIKLKKKINKLDKEDVG